MAWPLHPVGFGAGAQHGGGSSAGGVVDSELVSVVESDLEASTSECGASEHPHRATARARANQRIVDQTNPLDFRFGGGVDRQAAHESTGFQAMEC